MTNITKAAQQALEALDSLLDVAMVPMTCEGLCSADSTERWEDFSARRDALRAALTQRPAAQPTPDAIREHLEGIARRACTDEQFKAFEWVIDTAFESLDLLPAPQQATPKPVAPEMSSIALRKLGGLQDRGWQINGYAIRRGNERGFVDASGFVGWWRSEIAPVVPDDVARDAERWRKFSGLDYKVRREWASNLSLVPVLTEWVDSLPSPLAASQQNGGSAG